MRKGDVPGYNNRSHAVYECLKREFVQQQLQSGAANDVVVTLISMSDKATVLLHRKPFGDSLIDDLDWLSQRRPRSHGYYIPALNRALKVLKADAPNMSSLLLLFFSDGAPSDRGKHCQIEKECCERIKRIGQVFGRDKVILQTVAFGPASENFSLLEKMAKVLPRGQFQKLGLNVSGLKTSFSSLSSSLSTLRTEGGCQALTRRSDKVVDKTFKLDDSDDLYGEGGWSMYAFGDLLGKFVYNRFTRKLHQVGLEHGVNGFAFHETPFSDGAERLAYYFTEIMSYADEYDGPNSYENSGERCGLRMVAKEAKDVENLEKGRKFHAKLLPAFKQRQQPMPTRSHHNYHLLDPNGKSVLWRQSSMDVATVATNVAKLGFSSNLNYMASLRNGTIIKVVSEKGRKD